MKKLLAFFLLMLLSVSGFAALQYQIVTNPNGVQDWNFANEIKLKVTEGGSLWFSSFVSNWDGLADLGNLANMSAGQYGATVGGIQTPGTGTTKTVTFADGLGHQVGTSAYYVGDFNSGDEVSFWITSKDNYTGSSIGTVDYPGLGARLLHSPDLAGNVWMNFSFGSGGVDFIALGGDKVVIAGQPLPGVAIGLLIGGGLLSSAAIRRRKAKQTA
ncbi:MAG: hypothetical protein AB7F32_06025 [Victivallaceae bacterium]